MRLDLVLLLVWCEIRACSDASNELRPVGLIGPSSLIWGRLVTGYDGLLNGISKGLGLSPGHVVTAGEELVDPDATVVAFPYDFRRSVEHIANDLNRARGARAGAGTARRARGTLHGWVDRFVVVGFPE